MALPCLPMARPSPSVSASTSFVEYKDFISDNAWHEQDESLLKGFVEGDREKFSLLIQKYQTILRAYLQRHIGDSHLAEDALQETWLQVLRRVEKYEFGRSVFSWLHGIARYRALDVLRRRGKQEKTIDYECTKKLIENSVIEDTSKDEMYRVQEEMLGRVDIWMGELPDDCKKISELFFVENLSYIEIADRTKNTRGTVHQKLRKARTLLRKRHQEQYAEVA